MLFFAIACVHDYFIEANSWRSFLFSNGWWVGWLNAVCTQLDWTFHKLSHFHFGVTLFAHFIQHRKKRKGTRWSLPLESKSVYELIFFYFTNSPCGGYRGKRCNKSLLKGGAGLKINNMNPFELAWISIWLGVTWSYLREELDARKKCLFTWMHPCIPGSCMVSDFLPVVKISSRNIAKRVVICDVCDLTMRCSHFMVYFASSSGFFFLPFQFQVCLRQKSQCGFFI